MVDGDVAHLRRRTASETNNSGSEVEHLRSGAWSTVGFIAGYRTTTEAQTYTFSANHLQPGTRRFRLRQVDHDGTAAYSTEVEVAISGSGRFVLEAAYPKPICSEGVASLRVREAVPARSVLYNMLGQQVRVLYDDVPAAGMPGRLQIGAPGLPDDTYLLRIRGPEIDVIRRMTLLK